LLKVIYACPEKKISDKPRWAPSITWALEAKKKCWITSGG